MRAVIELRLRNVSLASFKLKKESFKKSTNEAKRIYVIFPVSVL